MKLVDQNGHERDFFFEMQKHAGHLRTEFTARQLAIYELYKKSIELPGSVAEFGVRNGANFFFLARLLEIFNPAQRFDGISSRHLYGFDTFSGFPDVGIEDKSTASWSEMKVGGVTTERDVFFADLQLLKNESTIGPRLHVVEGDVMQTLPSLLKNSPGLRFSFVFLDMDLYAPTKLCLEEIWGKVVPGGVVVFDEYGLPEFPGESLAVDEFFGDKKLKLHSIPWCYCPSAYVIKP
jgi:hypothetical protein